MKEAGITGARGRLLYTENYYTSIALAKHMFNMYVWTIVGTIVPTGKKSRADHGIPFLKCKMDQEIDYKENGTVRHLSRSRL